MATNEHPISGLMETTLEKIRQMVDANTIVGNPIHTADGATILPVSRISFGFASGGSDFAASKAPSKDLFGGGSGAGVSIMPIAFLVIQDGNVRLIQLAEKSNSSMDRILNMLPEVIDKVQSFIKDKKDGGKTPPPPEKGQDEDDGPVVVEETIIVEEML